MVDRKEKRKMSSFTKALLIAGGLALLVVGALCIAEVVSASGDIIRTISVDTDVKNDDKLVSVEETSATIETQKLTIRAKKIEATMLSEQRAIVRFKVDKDFANALVLNTHGDIDETHEFLNGKIEIEFSETKTNTVVILASEDDKYGSNQDREDFLDWCERKTRGIDKLRTIDFFIDESVNAPGSNDFVGIVVVKTTIVPPEITNIIWEWDDDELEITGESNLPRRTEVEWEIFGKSGITKVKSKGKVNFHIDLEGIHNRDDYLIMRVGSVNWFQGSRLGLGTWPESAEPGISIKPIATPTPTPKARPTPTQTPTPKISAGPPAEQTEPAEERMQEALAQIRQARETLDEETVFNRAKTLILGIPRDVIIGIFIGSALLVIIWRLYRYKKRK